MKDKNGHELNVGDTVQFMGVLPKDILSGVIQKIEYDYVGGPVAWMITDMDTVPWGRYSKFITFVSSKNEEQKMAQVSKEEKPCKSCSRNNFVGDKACWWCEVLNPTG